MDYSQLSQICEEYGCKWGFSIKENEYWFVVFRLNSLYESQYLCKDGDLAFLDEETLVGHILHLTFC
jgi:hypothetical protein